MATMDYGDIKGDTGDGLEFTIVGNTIGVRVKPNNETATSDYVFTPDLKGDTGLTGSKGDTGTVYTPVITSNENKILLGWSNDGGLVNPATINIKGDKGDTGTTLFTIVTANTFAELPSTGETGIIYCVPNGTSGSNSFDNYLWYNGAYDSFGSLEVDLSDYYTKSEVDTNLGLKADVTTTYNKTEVDSKIASVDLTNYYTKTEIDNLIGTANDIITG